MALRAHIVHWTYVALVRESTFLFGEVISIMKACKIPFSFVASIMGKHFLAGTSGDSGPGLWHPKGRLPREEDCAAHLVSWQTRDWEVASWQWPHIYRPAAGLVAQTVGLGDRDRPS